MLRPIASHTQTHKHEQILRGPHTTQTHNLYTQVNVEIKTQRHIHTYTSHGTTIISTVQWGLFILADDVAGGCEPSPRIVKRFMFLQ